MLDKVATLGDELKRSKAELEEVQQAFHHIAIDIPNIPHPAVPEGNTEDDNEEVRCWGEIKAFDFKIRDHVDLGTTLGLLDFEAATRITGSRFVVMRGGIARLHRALIQFMLDTHTQEHGYEEVNVPYLVNTDSLYGTGQLPKFSADLFRIPFSKNSDQEKNDWYLIPTAEVPVTNLLRDTLLSADDLPMKYVCHSPCFRSEAGSYGKDTRGMIRQHQFEKVELVQMVQPECSYDTLEELTGHAEKILQKLQLPYRVVILCGGDLGFASAKTYDIEVWLPGQQKYREISSCSNFETFQARRIKARWRNHDKSEFIHTLNGSGLAVGRTLIAIMENYQDKEGNIHIPDALLPYMDGVEVIANV